MNIKVLASGSNGNCYLLKDSDGNELLVECGISINEILPQINIEKFDGCIVSHAHKDHALAVENLRRYGFNVYTEKDLSDGVLQIVGCWKILPIKAYHNIFCFSYIIYNTVEKKKILFVTDSYKINPNIADTNFDLALIECNYAKVYVENKTYTDTEKGYLNHLSVDALFEWLKSRQIKPKRLCLIHLSRSNKITREYAKNAFKTLFKKVYVADKGLTFEI